MILVYVNIIVEGIRLVTTSVEMGPTILLESIVETVELIKVILVMLNLFFLVHTNLFFDIHKKDKINLINYVVF